MASSSPQKRLIQEGPGWRLGWDARAPSYPALLGGEDWAMELTAEEFGDFRRLAEELVATLKAMADHLMAEEQLICELESQHVWLEVEGYPQAYGLRFILQGERRGEGGWPAPVAAQVMAAIATLPTPTLLPPQDSVAEIQQPFQGSQ